VTAGPASAATCPNCGRPVSPRDNFCEACRTELAPAVVSGQDPAQASACPVCGASPITPDGYCEACGRRVPASRDHTEIDLGLLAGVTDRGLRHHRNEDAMALATAESDHGPVGLAVVCDGVSSSQRPDEASLAASQAAVRVLLAGVRTGADLTETSRAAIAAAQDALAHLSERSSAPGGYKGVVPPRAGGKTESPAGLDPPSATFVSAVMTSEVVTLCWLGDSRAYWLGAGQGAAAQRLTRDDSVAEEMVAAGLLSEADALATPQAHVVTGWVGADSAGGAEPHVTRFEPPGPGVLMLCSDGLWNYQPEAAELAALALPLALTDPLGAAAALVQFALEAGGMDNITVVLSPFPPRARSPLTGEPTLPAVSPDPEEKPSP
jgi:serine/threonine protein phosphatase PrpC